MPRLAFASALIGGLALAGTVAAHAAQTGMGHDTMGHVTTMGHDSMGHGANASNQVPAATAGATAPADALGGANGAALMTKDGGR